jgi:hypothetical protein
MDAFHHEVLHYTWILTAIWLAAVLLVPLRLVRARKGACPNFVATFLAGCLGALLCAVAYLASGSILLIPFVGHMSFPLTWVAFKDLYAWGIPLLFGIRAAIYCYPRRVTQPS